MHLRMSAASWALFRLTTGCSWRGMCTGCLRDGIERWVWQRQTMARRRHDVSPQCRVCKQRMQAMNGEGGEQMGSPALEGSRFPFKKARGAPCKNPFGISGTRQNEFAQVRKLLRRLLACLPRTRCFCGLSAPTPGPVGITRMLIARCQNTVPTVRIGPRINL